MGFIIRAAVWSCTNAIKAHSVSFIPLKTGNWSSSCQTLIKYNSNSLEVNDQEEKESIDIELTKQKADPELMKMPLTLNDQV